MATILTPRSRSVDADELTTALAAPVADPLWLLARQWQTGAFVADDGGDPALVQVAVGTAPVTFSVPPSATGGLVDRATVEAEPAVDRSTFDTDTRVRLATELFRLLRDHGATREQVATIRTSLAAAHPLRPVTAGSSVAPHAGRTPDAVSVLTALADGLEATGTGALPAVAGLDLTLSVGVEPAVRAWFVWAVARDAAAGTSGDATPAFWDPVHLGYDVHATTAPARGAFDVVAEDYDGRGLDWYVFDRAPLPTAAAVPEGDGVVVTPTPVTFAGMPEPRYWAMERGDVNLDLISGVDPARTVLARFAHAYSNDWFVLPVDVNPGCVTVDALVVTDTFGSTTTVPAAAIFDGPTVGWRMYDHTPLASDTPDAAADVRVFLGPTPPPLESPPVEEVLIARDELANVAWVVERSSHDDDGDLVDRDRRWLELRPASDPAFTPATASAMGNFRLGTNLPDNWYPLLAQPDPVDGVQLALASLPAGASDVGDSGVGGTLVPHAPTTRLADEVAARTGTRVSRVRRLAVVGGRRRGWRARTRLPGAGEASSGLRFDVFGPPALAPDLVANGDLALARRGRVDDVTAAATQAPAVATAWNLRTVTGTRTSGRLEPSIRPGGHGWQLHVTADAAGGGLVQQWKAPGSGATTGLAQAWVLVLRGTVALGCGDGPGTAPDVLSAAGTTWQLLEARATAGFVNTVVLCAASADGAEFLVDQVTVRPTGAG